MTTAGDIAAAVLRNSLDTTAFYRRLHNGLKEETMPETKFTLGPWNFHPHYYPLDGDLTKTEEFDALSISIAKGEKLLGEMVAFFPKEGYSTGYPRVESKEELIANARLCVAAPDLVGALQSIFEALDNRYDGAPDSRTLWMGSHLEEIRAALQKAGVTA